MLDSISACDRASPAGTLTADSSCGKKSQRGSRVRGERGLRAELSLEGKTRRPSVTETGLAPSAMATPSTSSVSPVAAIRPSAGRVWAEDGAQVIHGQSASPGGQGLAPWRITPLPTFALHAGEC